MGSDKIRGKVTHYLLYARVHKGEKVRKNGGEGSESGGVVDKMTRGKAEMCVITYENEGGKADLYVFKHSERIKMRIFAAEIQQKLQL